MLEKCIRVSGKNVHYWEAGQGHPLILLPSAAGRAAEFHELIPFLEKTAHVYALDYPGFGQSDAQPGIQSSDDLAAFVDEWRAALGLETCDVAGFSMGGWIALFMALSQTPRIQRLILIASAAGKDPDVPLINPSGLSLKQIIDQFYFSPETKKKLTRRKLSPEEKKEIYRSSRAFDALLSYGQLMPKLQGCLDQISLPTLVVGAREDRAIPLFYQQQLHEGIKNSQLIVFDECGHAIVAEQPRTLAEAMIAFLQKS